MLTINSKYPRDKRLPFVHSWNCRQDFVVFLYPRDKLLFHRVWANMGRMLCLAIVNFFEQDEACAVLFRKTVDIFFILSRSSFHWDGIFNDFTTDFTLKCCFCCFCSNILSCDGYIPALHQTLFFVTSACTLCQPFFYHFPDWR